MFLKEKDMLTVMMMDTITVKVMMMDTDTITVTAMNRPSRIN